MALLLLGDAFGPSVVSFKERTSDWCVSANMRTTDMSRHVSLWHGQHHGLTRSAPPETLSRWVRNGKAHPHFLILVLLENACADLIISGSVFDLGNGE